jgi:serine/threonine-protein phosphatase 2A regulatory subunit B
VEFNPTGQYLATGDKGGRIVIFKEKVPGKDARTGESGKPLCEYDFHNEFQSHEPEFDYLKSLEIEEKINCIKWCRGTGNGLYLLSSNDKTIRLWKIYNKQSRDFSNFNLRNGMAGNPIRSLRVPKVQHKDPEITAVPRRVFSNAHMYHINSLSVNSDGETYMSADDLRINLWNMEISDQSFNIVDIKPENMEELTEVITAADFHPSHCNVFMYTSSRGCIKLADMRQNALCDSYAKNFEVSDEGEKSFFSEIIASISDAKFTHDGRYIISRDYLTLKIWDVNMEARPVKTIPIHEHLRSKLVEVYESDNIFDKFECAVSGDGNHFATGSYNNYFHVYDKYGRTDTSIEASKEAPGRRNGVEVDQKVDVDNIDFTKKTLHLTWHPQRNAMAVAGLNNLYIYST